MALGARRVRNVLGTISRKLTPQPRLLSDFLFWHTFGGSTELGAGLVSGSYVSIASGAS